RGHSRDAGAEARRPQGASAALRGNLREARALPRHRSRRVPGEGRGSPSEEATMSERLPGESLVTRGLEDLTAGRESAESLLVAIGAPRLRRLGVPVPDVLPATPEH